jgi:RHS repeat-associated protein
VALMTPDGTRWRYAYDPLGRRIAKQRLAGDGTVAEQTRFTWDGVTLAEQVTGAREPGGQPRPGQVTTWDYQPGTFMPVTQTERTWLRGAPQREIDQRFYAVVTDLIGTPSELIAPDGSMAGYQQHTLWGTTIWKPGGAASPLRFPGQYHDPETGLHYNNQRYYDPATARYLSPDPLGLAPAPNPHTYVPNPTRQTDPLGLMACGPGGNDNLGAALTRVGRWMSPEEHQSMLDTGMVQPGRTGVINVAHPADIQSYMRQALPGNRYVEFDIPENSLVQGGKVGWATIPGPESIFSRLNISRGLAPYEFPPALNIKWLASKLPLW